MDCKCAKENVILQLQNELNSSITKIAVLESNVNAIKDDMRAVKEDIKNIYLQVTAINKNLEDRFTSQDQREIQELRNEKSIKLGIYVSITTSILAPIIVGLVLWKMGVL